MNDARFLYPKVEKKKKKKMSLLIVQATGCFL